MDGKVVLANVKAETSLYISLKRTSCLNKSVSALSASSGPTSLHFKCSHVNRMCLTQHAWKPSLFIFSCVRGETFPYFKRSGVLFVHPCFTVARAQLSEMERGRAILAPRSYFCCHLWRIKKHAQ